MNLAYDVVAPVVQSLSKMMMRGWLSIIPRFEND